MKTAVIVTTYNRPDKLARSLPQIVAAANEIGAPVLVVDDGSTTQSACENPTICNFNGVHHMRLPSNRGLAGALNIGLAYWLADPSIDAIAYFQDDVEVDPVCLAALQDWTAEARNRIWMLTGHDAKEHAFRVEGDKRIEVELAGVKAYAKVACRATMMFARREAWSSVMPIRSKALGLPKRIPGREGRGEGSGVDWWIVRDCKEAGKAPLAVLCVPGLVRTFAFKAADSCWANDQHAGEDAPLNRDAIAGWLERRKQ